MYKQEMLLIPDTDPSWTTLSSASSLTEHHSQQLQTGPDISRHSSSIQGEMSVTSRACLQNVGVIFSIIFNILIGIFLLKKFQIFFGNFVSSRSNCPESDLLVLLLFIVSRSQMIDK